MIISRSYVHVLTFAAVALPLMLPQFAGAETIDCAAADVQCLIAAINQANADPHKTTIRLAGGTYALTNVDNQINGPNGLPSILTTLTIEAGSNGATLTRTSDAPDFRLLQVGSTGSLTLSGIHLVGGDARSLGGPLDPLSGDGGAILNDRGTVVIANCSLDSNRAGTGGALYTNQGTITISDSSFITNFTGSGGAGLFNAEGMVTIMRSVFDRNDSLAAAVISVDGDARISQSRFTTNIGIFEAGGLLVLGGRASISNTTFESNVSQGAGGILIDDDGVLAVRDSTFVDNGGEAGAGLLNRSGTVTVINTTFARNRMSLNGSRLGIAAANGGTMTIISSTFAENRFLAPAFVSAASIVATFGNGTTQLQNDILFHSGNDGNVQGCSGVVTSLGNNLIGDPFACGMTIQLTDLIGDARLGDLVDDGTPGNAHFQLLSDSQAIDAANNAACPKKDQIDQPRKPQCDIGAVEFKRGVPAFSTR